MPAEHFGKRGIERGEPIKREGAGLADEKPGERRGEGFGRTRPGHECRKRHRAGVLIEGDCRVVGDQPGPVEEERPVVRGEGGCDLGGDRCQAGEIDGAGEPGQLGRLGRGEAVEGAAIESCRRWGRSRGRRGTEEGKQRAADEAGQRACRHRRPKRAAPLAAGSGWGAGGWHGKGFRWSAGGTAGRRGLHYAGGWPATCRGAERLQNATSRSMKPANMLLTLPSAEP